MVTPDSDAPSEPSTPHASISDQLRALVIAREASDHDRGWNAALRDSIAIADREERRRLERSADAIGRRKSEGKKVSRYEPYGYALDADGETLVECRAEQEVIRIANRLHLDGLSLRKISAELAERKKLARNGQPFSAQQIKRILDGK